MQQVLVRVSEKEIDGEPLQEDDYLSLDLERNPYLINKRLAGLNESADSDEMMLVMEEIDGQEEDIDGMYLSEDSLLKGHKHEETCTLVLNYS